MASFEESHHALADDEEEISEGDDAMDGAEIEWEQVPSTLPEAAEIPHSFYSSTQVGGGRGLMRLWFILVGVSNR